MPRSFNLLQIRLLEMLLDVAHCTNTDVLGDEHVQWSIWHDEFIGLTGK